MDGGGRRRECSHRCIQICTDGSPGRTTGGNEERKLAEVWRRSRERRGRMQNGECGKLEKGNGEDRAGRLLATHSPLLATALENLELMNSGTSRPGGRQKRTKETKGGCGMANVESGKRSERTTSLPENLELMESGAGSP